MDLTQLQTDERTKLLLYGPPKAGKTKLVGDLCAAGFNLHWFDLENGIKTVLNAGLPTEALKRITYFRIPDHKLYPIAIDTMKAVFRTASPKKICWDHGVVNCAICAKDPAAKSSTLNFADWTDKDILVIDSFSQLSESALFKKILPHIKGDKGDDYKVEWDDYTAQSNALTEILTKMQVLPINCIVIAHDVDVEKDEKKEKLVPKGGTRNYSKGIGKHFDDIVYCYVLNGKHKIENSTTFSNNVLTGGRSQKKLTNDKGEISLLPLFQR